MVEAVEASERLVRITVRTVAGLSLQCPGCGRESQWEHSRYVGHVADGAIGGRPVMIDVSVCRLYCENADCSKITFVEQVDGLTERYQRRPPALRRVVEAVAVALAGSVGARLLAVLHHMLSGTTVIGCLMRISVPERKAPRVAGIDEFALLKGHKYAAIIIDADSGERIEVLPDRRAATVTAWLREHPGIRTVCLDGSGGFAQAIRDADPKIVQVMDRWHLWHGLTEAALKETTAHGACWGKFGPPLREGKRATTTRERWQQVHQLLDAGVGLLACSRQLGLGEHGQALCPPRPARPLGAHPDLPARSVDPYRDHLRRCRSADPAAPTTHLLAEIREMGYTGSANLLVRYINSGRVEADHATLSPRRVTRLLSTHPDHLDDDQRTLLGQLAGACPEMTVLATQIRAFSNLLTPNAGNDKALTSWIACIRAANLPFLHSFTNGLERDRDAVDAALTLPHHNGRTEGVNTKIKLIKRQTYGRAGHPLLRQRILLS
nr:ISL3 family transposase [Streptomyces sp. SID13588]